MGCIEGSLFSRRPAINCRATARARQSQPQATHRPSDKAGEPLGSSAGRSRISEPARRTGERRGCAPALSLEADASGVKDGPARAPGDLHSTQTEPSVLTQAYARVRIVTPAAGPSFRR